jgi:hypothetical protein
MAGIVANTSLTIEDALDLTVEQIEGIIEGMAANNSTEETDKLTDVDALRFLINSGGEL